VDAANQTFDLNVKFYFPNEFKSGAEGGRAY
jgi:hypothetical protein